MSVNSKIESISKTYSYKVKWEAAKMYLERVSSSLYLSSRVVWPLTDVGKTEEAFEDGLNGNVVKNGNNVD